MLALSLAVPEVITHRLWRMARAGTTPSARDRAEFQRMHLEKIAAFYASWNAMFLEVARTNMRLAFTPWWSWPGASATRGMQDLVAQSQRIGTAVMAAGLAPVQRRATANARRLRRTAWR